MTLHLQILSWALIFILRLRFSPSKSVVNILMERVQINCHFPIHIIIVTTRKKTVYSKTKYFLKLNYTGDTFNICCQSTGFLHKFCTDSARGLYSKLLSIIKICVPAILAVHIKIRGKFTLGFNHEERQVNLAYY